MADEEKHRQHCNHHHHLPPSHPRRRAICASLFILLLLAAATALVVWLVYRPNSPHFILTGAAVYALNATAPPQLPSLVAAAMQFTLAARNPNRRVSLRYDRLAAFAAYNGQPITPPAALPPFALPPRSAVVMSPVLGGAGEDPLPVPPELVNALAADQAYGVVGLRVVLTGRYRWKAGAVKLRHYGFQVRCDVLVGLRKEIVGRVPLLRSPPCKYDI